MATSVRQCVTRTAEKLEGTPREPSLIEPTRTFYVSRDGPDPRVARIGLHVWITAAPNANLAVGLMVAYAGELMPLAKPYCGRTKGDGTLAFGWDLHMPVMGEGVHSIRLHDVTHDHPDESGNEFHRFDLDIQFST